jgi:excisionase family DNA binding protein
MDGDPNDLLNVRDTARRLGVHENTVRNWVREGILTEAKVPGSRFHRFRASDVERLLAQRGDEAPSLLTERRSVNPEMASANQLKQWPTARPRDAQAHFPELVRRLLVETPGVTGISMRTGDGVALEGWDGYADSVGTDFLPAGRLAFELGVSKDPKLKADRDYSKRVLDAPSGRVFVFMTPLRWAGGPAWADARRTEGHFTDVRVLDGDDLEGWLRSAPAAHHWISEHLGLRPRDAVTIDTWWTRFSASTNPPLPSALFVAGRGAEASRLIRRTVGVEPSDPPRDPKLTVVQSEWADDALAFVYAALSSHEDAPPVQQPVILVAAADVWDRIIEQPGRSILIPQFAGADVGAALDRGHDVVSIVDRTSVSGRGADIALPRLDRSAASSALQHTGMDYRQADHLAALGRRSLPTLVRKLSRNSQFQRPSWASAPDAQVLAPLILMGTWTTDPNDLAAVEAVTGRLWSEIEPVVQRVAASEDPALRRIANHWAFTSPEEAFSLLQESLTTEAIERWDREIRELLLEPDPMLGLAPHERVAAQIRGVTAPHSASLRRGMGQGVALMGAMGAVTSLEDGRTLTEVATMMVRDLLDEANTDSSGRLWRQLGDVLPLLAEADPDTFLNAVDNDLTRAEPILMTLFAESDEGGLFGPSSPHPHLLWALETVCWAEPYLIEGVRLLTRLAALDPGGKSGNRPSASLATILCGWVRNTAASIEVRLQAIDAAYEISEEVGWRLTFDLWPTNHGWVTPPASPRLRDDWRPSDSSVSMSEWVRFVEELVARAIAHAGLVPERLARLVDGLAELWPTERDRVLRSLESRSGELSDAGRLVVWEELASTIAHHEQFPDAAWAMPQEVLGRMANLASQLEPEGDPQRLARLFDWRPDIPGIRPTDFERYDARLHELQADALRSVLVLPDAQVQLTGLAKRVKVPSHLGFAMARHDEFELSQMIPWLESEDAALHEAAANWVRYRARRSGSTWASSALRNSSLVGPARLWFISNLPPTREFWLVLRESTNSSDENAYWDNALIETVPVADVPIALEQLISHGRAWSAVHVVALALVQFGRGEDGSVLPFTGADITRLLDEVLQQPTKDEDISQMTSFYLGQLLDYLTNTGTSDDDMARFEFSFYRLLEHDREPQVLNRALSRQPEIFVDLVKLVYRGKSEPRSSASADEGKATQAWWVLKGWEGVPGQVDGSQIDRGVLNSWVRDARLALSDADRADVGDEIIGETLAHSPVGADAAWPAEPVRDLIETIGSRDLENGMLIGRRNSRGVTSRGVFDGGQLEREQAAQYRDWSRMVRAKWPRTSRILRELAESYERDARREDAQSDLRADRD